MDDLPFEPVRCRYTPYDSTNNNNKKRTSIHPFTWSFFFFLIAEEGWVVIVRGIHEEADEEALNEKFSDFGSVKDVHFNLDRRTGYVKVS
jgi:RNA-binding protein 8A